MEGLEGGEPGMEEGERLDREGEEWQPRLRRVGRGLMDRFVRTCGIIWPFLALFFGFA